MYLYRTGSQPSKASRIFRGALCASLCATLVLGGWYQRLVDLVPNHWGTLKTWQSRNILSLDYDLIDFGRRDAAASSALNELVAANLLFNRKVQEVVFNVERSFYELDAAHAGVEAADAAVKLPTTDRKSTELRQKHGLATAPEVLLARQREAQAEYDLEN